MKIGGFKMAAKIIVLAAIIVCGFLINVSLAAAPDVAASALLFGYYDVKGSEQCSGDFETNPNCGGLGLTDNYFAVTNNSTNWVQAHLRIRTGEKSIELLDFDFLLSPKDVFVFDLLPSFLGGNGIAFVSCDTKTLQNSGFTTIPVGNAQCVIMDANDPNFGNLVSLILKCEADDDFDSALTETMTGYVEVIGEGVILQAHDESDHCASFEADESDFADRVIPGRTIFDMATGLECQGGSSCTCEESDFANMIPVLKGEVYYATAEGGTITRFASQNADGIDRMLPEWNPTGKFTDTLPGPFYDLKRMIFHADDPVAEAIRCETEHDNGCFTYGDPTTVHPVADINGAGRAAKDLNDCFYTPTLVVNSVTTGVFNKFGAAATFGPTLADLSVRRKGWITQTAGILNHEEFRYASAFWADDMGIAGDGPLFKEFAESHIFNVPAPAFDIDLFTEFSFTFPFQHFIAESDFLKVTTFDLDENTLTPPSSKFISPGLPTTKSPANEAALFDVIWQFFEGYAVWTPTATNKTANNVLAGGQITGGSTVDIMVALGSVPYTPGYTGTAFTVGANQLDAKGLWYFSDTMEERMAIIIGP